MEKSFTLGPESTTAYAFASSRMRFSLSFKRFADFFCGIIAAVILSPLMLVIYAAIKISDRGPAIFRQTRVGRGGKYFTLYKFRSMRVDAEADGRARLAAKDDDRLTRVGRFIRAHHLDELPQLWNVIRGDMSFVGPRPERPVFVKQIYQANPNYQRLFILRPGLFSDATLYNGYTDTLEKMLRRTEMDLHYLQHRTLLGDIRIIATTAWFILSGRRF